MNNLLPLISIRLSMFVALFISPYLLTRILAPRLHATGTIAWAGIVSLALNPAVLLVMHYLGLQIDSAKLSLVHWILLLSLVLIAMGKGLDVTMPVRQIERSILLTLAAFTVCILPLTYLPGMDTYKWQDLATAVIIEKRIPWLIHPLSVFGFGPRAYPCIHPLYLASVQLLGNTGVDWGYFLVSLVSGITAISGASILAKNVFDKGYLSKWFSILYVFSPVFLRYNHWATGRGFFLAVLPLFVTNLLRLPRKAAIFAFSGTALLLLLTHKVGMVMFLSIPPFLLFSVLLKKSFRESFPVRLLYLLPFCALSIALTPNKFAGGPSAHACSSLYIALTRFGILAPLALYGLLLSPSISRNPPWPRIISAFLLLMPLAFVDMYGTLLFTPFLALMAVIGFQEIQDRQLLNPRILMLLLSLAITVQSLSLIIYRSTHATPKRIRNAARFLEEYDPEGPFFINAPNRVRTQIQAYVSGSPRFGVADPTARRVRPPKPPPSYTGSLRVFTRDLTSYLRGFLNFSDSDFLWYGKVARTYHVVIDNASSVPNNTRLIYTHDGIDIYTQSPATKKAPVRNPDS